MIMIIINSSRINNSYINLIVMLDNRNTNTSNGNSNSDDSNNNIILVLLPLQ